MKVCLLTSNYPPEARGGTEQVVTALAGGLRARGCEVTAITSSDRVHAGADERAEQYQDVAVHRLFRRVGEFDHNGIVRPRLLDLLRARLAAVRPDVVHVHSFAALGPGSLQVCRDLGLPVLLTFHDLWVTCARYFRLPPRGIVCPVGTDRGSCAPCLDRALGIGVDAVAAALAERDRVLTAEVALAARCTAPSRTAAACVRDCLPYAGEIDIVPHGLLQAVAAGERAAAPAPGQALRVGTFGGLGPEKGVVELIDALAGQQCELHLAGRHLGAAAAAAVARARQRGTPVALRAEYGPDDRHPARDLHLAVFPSKCQETYGLVVDEALAHGVPCVVSDRGALAERAGQPGVVVAPLAKLAAILHDLVTHPERVEALRAAIPAELPTIALAAARYLDLYRSLA